MAKLALVATGPINLAPRDDNGKIREVIVRERQLGFTASAARMKYSSGEEMGRPSRASVVPAWPGGQKALQKCYRET